MRIVRDKIFEAASCGGLLDGMDIELLRPPTGGDNANFSPICLLGKNGTGKSQFLQIIAEIFQAAWHEHRPDEEATVANPELLFEIIYEVGLEGDAGVKRVKLSREKNPSGRVGKMLMELKGEDGFEALADNRNPKFGQHLPPLVVAYTSGDNETLSLPFYISRSGYASSVATAAMKDIDTVVPDNRLVLLDYSTHLEVLVANLMVAPPTVRTELVSHANLSALHSFRLVIQLNHTDALKIKGKNPSRKGVQLTDELEHYITQLCHANLSALHSFRLVIQLNHTDAPKIKGKNPSRKGVQLTDELEHYITQLCSAATCWDLGIQPPALCVHYRSGGIMVFL